VIVIESPFFKLSNFFASILPSVISTNSCRASSSISTSSKFNLTPAGLGIPFCIILDIAITDKNGISALNISFRPLSGMFLNICDSLLAFATEIFLPLNTSYSFLSLAI